MTADNRWCVAAVGEVFERWSSASASHLPAIDRMLAYLRPCDPAAVAPEFGGRALLNAQLSVDTAHPDRLRLTLDPQAGRVLGGMPRRHVLEAFSALGCRQLSARVTEMNAVGGDASGALWMGIAPSERETICKAYMVGRREHGEQLAVAARRAGWLPPMLDRSFCDVYERLTPAISSLEGVGIGFRGDTWIGTTIYLRATVPWQEYSSRHMARLVDLDPHNGLSLLEDVLRTTPRAFGWSFECSPSGTLVDIKAEISVTGALAGNKVGEYARSLGLVSSACESLGRVIAAAGLSEHTAAPSVISVRFVGGRCAGLVGYFPLFAARPLAHRRAARRYSQSNADGSAAGSATRRSS